MEIRRRPPNPIVRVENLEYAVPHREAKAKNILEEIVWHKDTAVSYTHLTLPTILLV